MSLLKKDLVFKQLYLDSPTNLKGYSNLIAIKIGKTIKIVAIKKGRNLDNVRNLLRDRLKQIYENTKSMPHYHNTVFNNFKSPKHNASR